MNLNEAKLTVSDALLRELVEKNIKHAMFAALSENPEAVVEKVVEMALSEKKDSYSRRTIFEDAVHDMIRKAAVKAFEDWCRESEDKIKQAVIKHLHETPEVFADKIATAVVKGLADSFHVEFRLKVEEE